MYLLYCDESNLDERAGDFLVYGGVMIDGKVAPSLSSTIEKIRMSFKLEPTQSLKFNPRPDHLDHGEFIELKQAVIEAAIKHDVGLLVYVILHDISQNPDKARRNGINHVCFHFNSALKKLDDHGLVLIDRFNDAGNQIEGHLTEKFGVGLTGMPYANKMRLDSILGFHYSAIGQSHFPSLIDIVLGSLRYSINCHTRGLGTQREGAHRLLGLLSPLFLRLNGEQEIPELGFIFSPKIVKVSKYRDAYQSLKDFLAEGGVVTKQQITDQRTY